MMHGLATVTDQALFSCQQIGEGASKLMMLYIILLHKSRIIFKANPSKIMFVILIKRILMKARVLYNYVNEGQSSVLMFMKARVLC